MATIFVVETGAGSATATSYTSVEYADDYFEVMPEETAWDALDCTTKEYYLMWATRLLDQKTTWRGSKAVTTSALRWPRANVRDKDGNTVSSTTIPTALKNATCELARFLISYDPTTGQGGDNLKRIAVDVVEIEYQEGVSQNDWPTLINDILTPLGTFKTRTHGFGRILRV